jgi:hypothetical protein
VRWLATLSLIFTAACTSEARPLEWEVVLPSTVAPAAIHTSIREESCDGAPVYEVTLDDDFSLPPDGPPRLSPGRYAFRAEAVDTSCRTVAVGCETVDLPSEDASVTVVLLAVDGAPLCVPAECNAGFCISPPDAGPLDTLPPIDSTPADSTSDVPNCSDGRQNGDETGVDCGGTCIACPDWDVGDYGTCDDGSQSRDVRCLDGTGAEVDASECPAPMPDTSQSCASARYRGYGCPDSGSDLSAHILDDLGDCADRSTCSGCPGPLPLDRCIDHCRAKAIELGMDLTCEISGCSTECWVYAGHGFIANDDPGGGCRHSIVWAWAP